MTTVMARLKPPQSSPFLPKPPHHLRQSSRPKATRQMEKPEGVKGNEGRTQFDLHRTAHTQPHKPIDSSFPFLISPCDKSCMMCLFLAIYVPHQQCYLRRLDIILPVSYHFALKVMLR